MAVQHQLRHERIITSLMPNLPLPFPLPPPRPFWLSPIRLSAISPGGPSPTLENATQKGNSPSPRGASGVRFGDQKQIGSVTPPCLCSLCCLVSNCIVSAWLSGVIAVFAIFSARKAENWSVSLPFRYRFATDFRPRVDWAIDERRRCGDNDWATKG